MSQTDRLTDDEYHDLIDLAARLEETGHIGGEEARVYVFREIGGLGRSEAADVLDKNPTTMDSQLRYARHKIESAERLLDIVNQYRGGSGYLDQLRGDAETIIQRVADETELSQHEATIVVLDHLGRSVEDIGDELGRRSGYVDGELSELRQKRDQIGDDIERLERTKAALDGL